MCKLVFNEKSSLVDQLNFFYFKWVFLLILSQLCKSSSWSCFNEKMRFFCKLILNVKIINACLFCDWFSLFDNHIKLIINFNLRLYNFNSVFRFFISVFMLKISIFKLCITILYHFSSFLMLLTSKTCSHITLYASKTSAMYFFKIIRTMLFFFCILTIMITIILIFAFLMYYSLNLAFSSSLTFSSHFWNWQWIFFHDMIFLVILTRICW